MWLQHVQRMDTSRIPKQALQYRPKGRRNIGRPKKRWRDQLHFEDQGTGNTLRCVIPVVCVTNDREKNVVKQHN